jgi:hypothetical protein
MLLIAVLTGKAVPFTRPKPGLGTQALDVLDAGGASLLMGHGKHSTWRPPGEKVSAGHLCSSKQHEKHVTASMLHNTVR